MIQEFTTYLTDIRGYSHNTATAYVRDIRTFIQWLKNYDTCARWSTITRDDIDAYIVYQSRQGKTPATTNRHLSSISAIYKYMKRQGYDIEDPTKTESRRKFAKTIPNTIPTEDLRKAYEANHGARKIMLGILITTGMRIQEMLDIEWEDINPQDLSIRVTGKGNKQRITYTTTDIMNQLQAVRSYASPQGKIFPIDQRQARYMIWEALKPYTKAKQTSPHAIRHTYATNLAKHGENVTTIAGLLGHQDIKTTQKYIDMSQQNYKEATQKWSILN